MEVGPFDRRIRHVSRWLLSPEYSGSLGLPVEMDRAELGVRLVSWLPEPRIAWLNQP